MVTLGQIFLWKEFLGSAGALPSEGAATNSMLPPEGGTPNDGTAGGGGGGRGGVARAGGHGARECGVVAAGRSGFAAPYLCGLVTQGYADPPCFAAADRLHLGLLNCATLSGWRAIIALTLG